MAQLANVMTGLNDVLEAQVCAGLGRDEVLDALYRSCIERIDQIKNKLANTVVAQLTNAIKDSPFLPEHKKSLARAVLNIGTAKKKSPLDQTRNATIWRTSFQRISGSS